MKTIKGKKNTKLNKVRNTINSGTEMPYIIILQSCSMASIKNAEQTQLILILSQDGKRKRSKEL